MRRDARLATELEEKHFLELTAPIRVRSHDRSLDRLLQTPALNATTARVLKEVERFGYIPHPVHLLVRIDPGCHDPILTSRQKNASYRDLAHLHKLLGVRLA